MQATRLGKLINDLRRKTTDRKLASRAKNLVKKWRKFLNTAPEQQQQQPPPQLSNGHNHGATVSPATPIPSGASSATTARNAVPSAVSSPSMRQQRHNNHSSLPSSASTSPALTSSRPASRPVSPYNNDVAGVSKTNAANKRVKKESAASEGEPPPKLQHMQSNGFVPHNSEFLLDGDTRDSMASATSNTCDSVNSKVPPPTSTTPAAVPKRKTMTRRSFAQQQQTDVLEQQMLSVKKGSGKVRTTQEIVEELARRSHSPGLVNNHRNNAISAGVDSETSSLVASETKTQLMSRFFDSQSAAAADVISPPQSQVPSPSSASDVVNGNGTAVSSAVGSRAQSPSRQNGAGGGAEDSVEELMASLPVINAEEVRASWEVEEEDEEMEDVEGLIPTKRPGIEVTPELVEKLHDEPMENFNGNFDHAGEFKEWHEVVTKESKGGELLYVLPYSIID